MEAESSMVFVQISNQQQSKINVGAFDSITDFFVTPFGKEVSHSTWGDNAKPGGIPPGINT